MTRVRHILGLIGAGFMALSFVPHTLLGWPKQHEALVKAGAPPDLVKAMGMGWVFGGIAMLAMGLVSTAIFVHALRGQAVSKRPAIVIGLSYVAFSAWSIAVIQPGPFISVFLVPGLLLLVGAWPATASSST